MADQLHEDFGVGLALEFDASVFQVGTQGLVVFYDAVVDQCDAAAGIEVRVGVFIARDAVGRPAGVGHAAGAVGETVEFRLQNGDSPGGFLHSNATVPVEDGDSGGVISPVFEALKALHQD